MCQSKVWYRTARTPFARPLQQPCRCVPSTLSFSLSSRSCSPYLRGRSTCQEGTQEAGSGRASYRTRTGESRRQRSAGDPRLLCGSSQFDYRRRPSSIRSLGTETASAINVHIRKHRPGCRKKGLPKELDQLKRLVDRGLAETATLWPSVQITFGWVHKAAQILENPTEAGGAEVRRRLASLLGAMSCHQGRAGNLTSAVAHFIKVSRSYWPGYFTATMCPICLVLITP